MRHVEGQAGMHASAPIATIGPDWDYALVPFVALMTWPKERRRQSEAVATFAAQMKGLLDDVDTDALANRDLSRIVEALAAKVGVPAGEILTLRHARSLLQEAIRGGAEDLRSEIDRALFRPAGGFRVVADAPGASWMKDQMRRASEGGAMACGYLLVFVARLALFHRSRTASLNRANAVLSAWATETKNTVPIPRRRWEAWTEWRGVAPLWAAYATMVGGAVVHGGEPFVRTAETDLSKPEGVQQLVARAKWFRQFAVEHRPQGAKGVLIPACEALFLDASVAEARPPLAPLPPHLLKASRTYMAPK